ncbi:MAG: DUF882 domain-containing protein [Desulfobulbaceae bacterium]|nr:DUF882 domain-containing protein [Desulfobulbaceae bacterium]
MVTDKSIEPVLSRRFFLKRTTQIALGLTVLSVPAISCAKVMGKRSLSFYHTHTQQALDITYAWGKVYNPRALAQISYYLRDHQTGKAHPIDPKLLDILWSIQGEMGRKGVYEVISGYRSPQTNKQLRRKSSGVAGQSLHMQGKAIDIRFPGIDTDQIHQCAVEMKSGGVGYYAKSDFVHLDTGDYRTW